MDETRKAARWRKRRIIFNNDGDDVSESKTEAELRHAAHWRVFTRSGGELMDDYLNARSTPLVGTQVDSIWYSTCRAGITFWHRTEFGGFCSEGIPQELIDKYGRDILQIQVDFCRKHDMEAFWSLRMNDVHDSYPVGHRSWHYRLGPFKREHPEYLMGEPDDWEKYPDGPRHLWSALDFSHAEVREHIFSLVREVCQGYDVNGVELDFFRHPKFFAPTLDGLPAEQQHLEMMTDLMRRVRKMADEVGQQRGRPLLLAARAPFNPADAQFIGLDLETWLAEDLIDILIPGGGTESRMTESFQDIVNLGHKYDVPVYPCIGWAFWKHWAFLEVGEGKHRTFESWVKTQSAGDPKYTEKPFFVVAIDSWEGTMAAWRGAATNLFNAGADGIYTFNAFSPRNDIWREIGDPKTMENKDKIFGVDRFAGDSSFKDVRELELKPGEPVSVPFQVGEDVNSGNSPELQFRLHFWDFAHTDDLAVKLNQEPLKELKPTGPMQTPLAEQWLECPLNPAQVKRGENRVDLMVGKRDESMPTPLVLDAVQLHVRHKG